MNTKSTGRRRKEASWKNFELMTVGDRIRWLLVIRQLTQTEVAKRAGVSQSAISNMVRDGTRRPNAKTLLALATAFDCLPSFILSGVPTPYLRPVLPDHQENELLHLFDRLDALGKHQLIAMAKILRHR